MAEDGSLPETETGRPESSIQVPLNSRGCPTCALKPLCTSAEGLVEEGAKEMEGKLYAGGQGFWWLIGSKSC